MRNLADAIENFIINQLVRESEDTLLVQRNELAERLSCAPSQISYVLSTRFTPERGFMVESRRGSGGFIRIVRMEPSRQLKKDIEPTADDLIEHLAAKRLITGRERVLLKYMLGIIDADDSRKKAVLQQAVHLLDSAERGKNNVV